MKYAGGNLGRIFILQLEHGDTIPDAIEAFAAAQGVEAAVVIFLGGAEEGSKVIVGPREGTEDKPVPAIAALPGVSEAMGVGTIFANEEGAPRLHMHSAFGRKEGTITGCTREGLQVWNTGEVALLEIENTAAMRKVNPHNGFELLEIKKNG